MISLSAAGCSWLQLAVLAAAGRSRKMSDTLSLLALLSLLDESDDEQPGDDDDDDSEDLL